LLNELFKIALVSCPQQGCGVPEHLEGFADILQAVLPALEEDVLTPQCRGYVKTNAIDVNTSYTKFSCGRCKGGMGVGGWG
jgi:hypothetical protein